MPCSSNGPLKTSVKMGHRFWIILSQWASEQGRRVKWVMHMIYKVQREASCCLISSLIMLMANSSSQPHSPSPAADSDGPGEVGATVWKWRYLALQETVNTEKSSKFQYVNYSNSEIHLLTFVRNTTSISRLGQEHANWSLSAEESETWCPNPTNTLLT